MKKLLLTLSIGSLFTLACSSDDGNNSNGNSTCDNGCMIQERCYPAGVLNPTNPCEYCNATTSQDSWSNNDGADCDDELFCTENDICEAGACTGTIIEPDDGVDCNGTESCDEENDTIISTGGQCPGNLVCDVLNDECLALCVGCKINNLCYGAGQINPLNQCEVCLPDSNPEDWSANDGVACDDGLFCTGPDFCHDGQCSGTDLDVDDAIDCNGTESCDESSDIIVHAIAPEHACSGDEVCDMISNQCVDVCPGCLINDLCYGHLQYEPGNACRQCNIDINLGGWIPNHGVAYDGECICDYGFEGHVCQYERCAVFVAPDGDDGEAGDSWTTAKASIQAGIDTARLVGCDVWVAEGEYQEQITLSNNVAVYGSFAGNEVHLAERTVEEIMVNNKPVPNPSSIIDGNSLFTVIICDGNSDCGEGTAIDGFVISDGQSLHGGGFYINEASPEIRNCLITNNQASNGGGGYLENARPTFKNCHFSNNHTLADGYGGPGGAIFAIESTAQFSNCVFTNNQTADGTAGDGGHGGVIYSQFSAMRFANCIFANNKTGNGSANRHGGNGGVLYNYSSSHSFVNCAFLRNETGSESGTGHGGYGAVMYNDTSFPILSNCLMYGNVLASGGYGNWFYNANESHPKVYNSILWDGNIYNSSSTTTISYSAVQGGYTGTGNTAADPLFHDPANNDFGMDDNSPCLNRGLDELLFVDVQDIDYDGNRNEYIPLDLNNMERVLYGRIDMGPFEDISEVPEIIDMTVTSGNEITIEFSEPMDQETIETLENYFISNGVTVLYVALDTDGKILTIVVDSLNYADEFVLLLNNLNDQVGTELIDGSSQNISMTALRPQLQSVQVDSATDLILTFSEALGSDTCTDVANYVLDTGLVVLDAIQLANPAMVLLQTENLNAFDGHSLIMNNVTNTIGIAIPMNTSFPVDIGSLRPQLESLAVDSYTDLLLTFDRELDSDSVSDLTNYSITNSIQVLAVTQSSDLKRVHLSVTTLEYHDEYILTLGQIVTPMGIRTPPDKQYPFANEDIKPKITKVLPTSIHEIQVTFNKVMNLDSMTDMTHYAVEGQSLSFLQVIDQSTVQISFSTFLEAGTDYTLTASGVQSAAGFVMSPSQTPFKIFTQTSCKAITTAGTTIKDGMFAVWLNATVHRIYCDMTTNGGNWTLIFRLDTNDDDTRSYGNTSFWESFTEMGSIDGHSDYLSENYDALSDWDEILVDFRYTTNQAKRMAAIFASGTGTNSSSLRAHMTQTSSNTNPDWPRGLTFSEGENADAANWYGSNLKFQTLGNGTDNFRIWFNQVSVDYCNQAGGIGCQGDDGNWYSEVSFPSNYTGGPCQENYIRGTIGSNGGGSLMGETLLSPEDAYNEGIMYVLVR